MTSGPSVDSRLPERRRRVDAAFSILINSCDQFNDCWEPFFELFTRYWPGCSQPIFLNTETKGWSFPTLRVQCTQVQTRSLSPRRLTWSECLAGALSQIDTDLLLYMQEDYFVDRPIDVASILDLAELMRVDPDIRHIGLTDFGSHGPFERTDDPRLWKISLNARYRISLQAGLWRTDSLKSYLRPWENAWMLEIFGARRSARQRDPFLTVNREIYNARTNPIIHYLHTGIIKGRWHPDVPRLFGAHGIRTDFQKRGFYRTKNPLLRRLGLVAAIASHPLDAARSLFQ